MRYKSVRQIVEEFNVITELLQNNSETEDLLIQYSNEIKSLKLWAFEFGSHKTSIYVGGKTGTGKSEFHNFILDIPDPKLRLFKTSNKVETSVFQTLQHCESIDKAYAEIYIKNFHEWAKIQIQLHEFGIRWVNQKLIKIKLTSIEEISFLRDVIMAKSDKQEDFKISEAANSINIFFPLKYFKNHRFIDTPGLGSHESETDASVRNEFQGKSHIFWFFDASKRSLSDSLMLLDKEKEFLKNNIQRSIFIGNKFDIPDNDDGDQNFHNNMAEALRITFLNGVQNIFKLDKIPEDIILIFTSLKEKSLNKKFGDHTTIEAFKNLEYKFLMDSKLVTFNNIEDFINTLDSVFVKLKNSIKVEKQKSLQEDVKKAIDEVERLTDLTNLIERDIKIVVPNTINGYIQEIKSIRKKKNLNTHDKYNEYLVPLTKSIINTHRKLIDLTKAKLSANSLKLNLKLQEYKKIDDFKLKQGEGFIKKYFKDEELDSKKEKLSQYGLSKIQTLKQIEIQIIEDLYKTKNNYAKDLENEYNTSMGLIQKQEYFDMIVNLINNVIDKLDKDYYLLLKEVEEDISNWGPANSEGNSIDILNSFLHLNYLLDEHHILKQRTRK